LLIRESERPVLTYAISNCITGSFSEFSEYITNISIVASKTTPTITVELKTKERAMHMAKYT